MRFIIQCFRLNRINHYYNLCSLKKSVLHNHIKPIQQVKGFATRFQQDITLYKYERSTFYKVLAAASLSQLVFWSYMSYIMYVYIRPASQMLQEHNTKQALEKTEDLKKFRYFPKILLTSKAQTAVSIGSFAVGLVFLFTGSVYATRSVNKIVLLRNGSRVIIRTYNPFGGLKQISTPLEDVSCIGSRLDNKSFVVFKIRNHRFYYMIDKRGEFLQPTLFDTSVGVKRWTS